MDALVCRGIARTTEGPLKHARLDLQQVCWLCCERRVLLHYCAGLNAHPACPSRPRPASIAAVLQLPPRNERATAATAVQASELEPEHPLLPKAFEELEEREAAQQAAAEAAKQQRGGVPGSGMPRRA